MQIRGSVGGPPYPKSTIWRAQLWPIIFLTTTACIKWAAASNEDDLQPPHSVKLVADTEHSFTLTWEDPELKDKALLIRYSVHYYSKMEPERELSCPVGQNSQLIPGLQPGTNYTVYVTAHYTGNKSLSSPKFIMSTVADPSNSLYKDCMCYDAGTKSCEHRLSGGHCVCEIGYEGRYCDTCVDNFYRSGEACKPCPCAPELSDGSCELGTSIPGEVACKCKPGYMGPLCDMCVFRYYPVGDFCVPCQCLFCRSDPHHISCSSCPSYSHNFTNHKVVAHNCGITGHPRLQQRTVSQGDGTVAVVAVVVSLSFIACVAGAITCYRRRMQARNQLPFWSIELAEDKISLNTGSDYQRLEGASKQASRSNHQRSPSVAEATAAQHAANQPQYNCISI